MNGSAYWAKLHLSLYSGRETTSKRKCLQNHRCLGHLASFHGCLQNEVFSTWLWSRPIGSAWDFLSNSTRWLSCVSDSAISSSGSGRSRRDSAGAWTPHISVIGLNLDFQAKCPRFLDNHGLLSLDWRASTAKMWKSSVGKVDPKSQPGKWGVLRDLSRAALTSFLLLDDDDDWETDPDYVNTMSEEQQRWGGARDGGAIE